MRGISFYLDDKEEVRRDKINKTNREIYLLGLDKAEELGLEDGAPAETQEA